MILSSQVLILTENISTHPEGIKVAKVKLKDHISFREMGDLLQCKILFLKTIKLRN